MPGDETDLEQFDRTFRAYVAGVGDDPWGAGQQLWGSTDDEALFEVADGAQDYLAGREHLVWPVCPTHDRGVHVRPAGTARDWVHEPTEGGPLRPGPPAWLCNGGEGHDLDLIGKLAQSGRPGPKRKRRRRG